eukprot:TRINITY_DN114_c0_g1_i2.p1 TRINITY_DN114_c0_g1~~TRINITY_DN114_c0_g1_i2.p1  ORF type:complete len:810 (-),score=160.55 TRINITY_DN114_c0_g1_i2:379-2808(-)
MHQSGPHLARRYPSADDALAPPMSQMNLSSPSAPHNPMATVGAVVPDRAYPLHYAWDASNLPRPVSALAYDRASYAASALAAASSSQNFVRLTVNSMPNTADLANRCQMPFGAVIQPLADPKQGEKIPVINCSNSSIVRCKKCRTYINPFVVFLDAGRKWRCNMCFLTNEVPAEYYSPLDSEGIRRDIKERPELTNGTVEFIAPSEYMVRPPQPPVYFFVIDVSYSAISSGLLQVVCQTIRNILDEIPGGRRAQIGFLTFDTTLHFYNIAANSTTPKMIVSNELDQIHIPIPSGLLVELHSSRTLIEQLLDSLPKTFASTTRMDSALGAAINAAFKIMGNIGGKMVIFQARLPNIGVGALKNRDDPKLYGTDNEKKLLNPEDSFYKDLAVDFSRQQVSVDFFLTAPEYGDVAALSCLSRYTSGHFYYYPSFEADKDGAKLSHELSRLLTFNTVFESVMRVRCSQGFKVTAFHGNFFLRSMDLLAVPNCDPDKVFAVQFALEDQQTTATTFCVQSALLYTSSNGLRQIRVHTLCVPVIGSMAELYRNADAGAMATLMGKIAIERALSSRLQDAREELTKRVLDILSTYKFLSSHQSTPGQIVLPDSLKLLPLYVLAILKNVAFRPGSDIKSDYRTAAMNKARLQNTQDFLQSLYPRLYPLHRIAGGRVGLPSDETGQIILPVALNLASDNLENGGVYLLDDGSNFYLRLSRQTPSEWMREVFGLESAEGLQGAKVRLPSLNTDLNRRVNAILDGMRAGRSVYPKLTIIREGEPSDLVFLGYMVEDRTPAVMSYYEFLTHIHKQIHASQAK